MNTDRRTQYTRAVLQKSLLELLKERPIERITVKEICEKADINRSTFYVHYASPMDLLASSKTQLYEKIKEEKVSCSDMYETTVSLCGALQKHRDLIALICRTGKGVKDFLPIMELWKDDFLLSMEASGVPRDRLEMAFLFVACGTSAVVVSWVLDAFPNTAEEIAEEVCRLINGGLGAYFAK